MKPKKTWLVVGCAVCGLWGGWGLGPSRALAVGAQREVGRVKSFVQPAAQRAVLGASHSLALRHALGMACRPIDDPADLPEEDQESGFFLLPTWVPVEEQPPTVILVGLKLQVSSPPAAPQEPPAKSLAPEKPAEPGKPAPVESGGAAPGSGQADSPGAPAEPSTPAVPGAPPEAPSPSEPSAPPSEPKQPAQPEQPKAGEEQRPRIIAFCVFSGVPDRFVITSNQKLIRITEAGEVSVVGVITAPISSEYYCMIRTEKWVVGVSKNLHMVNLFSGAILGAVIPLE